MNDALHPHPVWRFEADGAIRALDTLAVETPVALVFNAEPYAVMLCTPRDLEDFALGFALSEGIVAAPEELTWIECLQREQGLVLQLALVAERHAAMEHRRALAGATGCGLCGAQSLAQAIRPVRAVPPAPPLAPARLAQAFTQMQRAQTLNARCGSLHAAAALCGDTLLVREDVGRHNALDKAIGAARRAGLPIEALLTTSRASYELVHKAAEAGVGVLAVVSGVTSLAAELAGRSGVCLVGFARDTRLSVYTHNTRLEGRVDGCGHGIAMRPDDPSGDPA